jgi:hypothetical protein
MWELALPAPGEHNAGGTDAGPGPVRAWWWRELRPLVPRVHFYAGLFVGPFLPVAATTQ